jgi:hypothetical protein
VLCYSSNLEIAPQERRFRLVIIVKFNVCTCLACVPQKVETGCLVLKLLGFLNNMNKYNFGLNFIFSLIYLDFNYFFLLCEQI